MTLGNDKALRFLIYGLLSTFICLSLTLRDRPSVEAFSFLTKPSREHTFAFPQLEQSVTFSTFIGGSMGEAIYCIKRDSIGNIVLFGDTNSPDFPHTSNAYQNALAGDTDLFIMKLTSDGSHIIFSTFLGGSGGDYPSGMALDADDNIYITGETFSTDFPLVHPYQTKNLSGAAFLSILNRIDFDSKPPTRAKPSHFRPRSHSIFYGEHVPAEMH